jgi:hypothetical protein
VAGGVVSSRLFPVESTAVAASAPVAAPASGAASIGDSAPPTLGPPARTAAAPAPTGPLTPRSAGLSSDPGALVAAIARRGAGTLAFVSGRLHSAPRPCSPNAPLSTCLSLAIEGLPGATVVPDDRMAAWPGDPPPGETLVLLARDGKLVLLGSMVVESAGIPRIDVLGARLAADPLAYERPLPSLHEVDGVLLSGAASCRASDPCRVGAPALLVVSPPDAAATDYQDAAVVQISPSPFGIDSGASRTVGPFLVRRRANPVDGAVSWEVVAREDQASVLQVVIP